MLLSEVFLSEAEFLCLIQRWRGDGGGVHEYTTSKSLQELVEPEGLPDGVKHDKMGRYEVLPAR